ncbi:hypothetical protein ACFL7M_15435 [Thermodesulfobacteriota bacterium]
MKEESMGEFGPAVRKILMDYREKRMLAKIARDIGIQPVRLTEMITQDESGKWKRKVTPYYITKLVDGGYMTVAQVLQGRRLEDLPDGQKTFFQRLLIPKKTLTLIMKAKERGVDVDGLIQAALGLDLGV